MSKIIFILCFCLVCAEFSIGQDYAYYLSSGNGLVHHGANIAKARVDSSFQVVEEVFSFTDSVRKYSIKDNFFWMTKGVDDFKINPEEIKWHHEFVPGAFSSSWLDTVLIDDEDYLVAFDFFDDRYVGGRPNHITKSIRVQGIGMIYSSSNWLDSHRAVMLWHSDAEKQRVLEQVYDYLANNAVGWEVWNEIAQLSREYSFSSVIDDLSDQWMSSKGDIRLVSYKSITSGAFVTYEATIKNNSSINYYFRPRTSVGPAEVIIHNKADSSRQDLTNTTYGPHYHRINDTICLIPGEVRTFTFSFRYSIGCVSCRPEYSGLQFYPSGNLFEHILFEELSYHGERYTLFPHRTLLSAEE